MPTEKELAKLALALLQRAELKGQEVQAYVAVSNWLASMAEDTPEVPEKPSKAAK